MDIYTKLQNRKYTLKEKIGEVVKLSQTLADKGANINDIGYAMLLRTALEHTNTEKEKHLAEKIGSMVKELEKGIKNKSPVGINNYGFQKRMEEILNQ